MVEKMWKIKKTERILDSEFVKVDKDDVTLSHGREIKDFYKVTIKDCAAIVAITEDNHIILKKEYRHCYGEELVEIPAGVLEDGEDPLETAKRELEEETGYTTDKPMEKLLSFASAIAFCDEIIDIYLATDLKPGKQDLDEDEFINVEVYSLEELSQMIYDGIIQDSKTIAGVMTYRTKYGK